MAFEKITKHPSRSKIVRMLNSGMGVRAVANKIKELYPDDKKLHLTPSTLQKFRQEKLNLDAEAIKLVKEATEDKREISEEKKSDRVLKYMPVYKEKLQEAIDVHIDIRQQLANLSVLISARTEALFDKAATGGITVNEEANLQKYFQTYITVIEKWAKYIDKIADQTVETNVNVRVIEDQVSVIQQCVRETLSEFEPELAIKFFTRLEQRMSQLSYRAPKPINLNQLGAEVKVITENIDE